MVEAIETLLAAIVLVGACHDRVDGYLVANTAWFQCSRYVAANVLQVHVHGSVVCVATLVVIGQVVEDRTM